MKSSIHAILGSRILVLDGAMGTMIQRKNLTESQFRGEAFKNKAILQKGNNDLLAITQPQIVEQIHREYLEAGADIIETNTFNATSISQQKYGMHKYIKEINIEATKIARKVADEFSKHNPQKPRFVAGSVGPTDKTTSILPRNRERKNLLPFGTLLKSYEEQIAALIEGGVDVILIETIYDTLNGKAGIMAAQNMTKRKDIPIIISFTTPKKLEDTYSGETFKSFLSSINHTNLLSVGLNCSFGAKSMEQHLEQLKKVASLYITAYPNAGLPNQQGMYEETPQKMGEHIKRFIDKGLVNIIGGCCGTTPKHIAEIARLVNEVAPPI